MLSCYKLVVFSVSDGGALSLRTLWIQYARIVREALCELELPYVLQNVGEGSSKTELLLRKSGSKQVIMLGI